MLTRLFVATYEMEKDQKMVKKVETRLIIDYG